MCKDSDKSLPTSKTALYTQLVQTILARHLTKHPTYKNDQIDIDDFTDLPDDIDPLFRDLTELAYENVTRQQLIIKAKDKPIQHLGLMHEVVQQLPNKHKSQHTYTFLHLSIKEYLGAVYMSQMATSTQERLVESMFSEQHLRNMAMFLAAITKSKGNKEIIKQITQSECKKEKDGTLTLSRYAIQMVFESEDVSLLEGHSHYLYKLDDSSPLFDFTALGYCIATSSYKWELQLVTMETTSGVDLLLHALHHHSSNSYTIESIKCWYKDPEVAQRLLAGLPHHTLPLIERLVLSGRLTAIPHIRRRPLPQCLPELVHKMNRLCVLRLRWATAVTLADTLQALATAPTCTLKTLDLLGSQFSPPAMQALHCALLRHSKSMTKLVLSFCYIIAEQVCPLVTSPLPQRLPELVHKMDRLCVLELGCVRAATLADILQALATAPTSTLETLNLEGSQFCPPVMQALHCALLRHRKSVTELVLNYCNIIDEQACLLATALNRLTKLREVDFSHNAIGDEGAVAIGTSLNRLPQLRKVDLLRNKLTGRGRKALENWEKNNTQVELRY